MSVFKIIYKPGRFPQISMNNSEQLPLIADRPLNIQTDEELCAGFGVDVCELRVAIVPSVVQLLV